MPPRRPRGTPVSRRSPDRRLLAASCVLGVLGLGATACEASLDEDGAEVDIDEDTFGDDG
jgi:hypothetical protein